MSGPEVIATTTELPESRVRLEATVPAELLERSIERAAKQVGRNMRVPGFRAGKIPPKLVVQRVGREAIVDEAIRADLNEWYDKAIRAANIIPIGQPDVDQVDLPAEGQPFVFTAEVGVIPTADVSNLDGLEVGKADPAVDDEAIDRELGLLRDRFARLETAERAIAEGDYVVIDYVGKLDGEAFPGGEGKNQLLEIGSGRFIPGFEEQLVGSSAGDTKTITVTFPDDYGAPELAGQEATFEITVHEVKAKELPELDDDFALEVGGVDTIDELRKDLSSRLGEAEERRVSQLLRMAVLDAAADKIGIEVPDAIAYEHAHQQFHTMMHRFEHQGISQDVYLQSVGKTHDEVVQEAVPSAKRQLARQAVASALIDHGKFTATDEELEEVIAPYAAQEKISLKKAWARLEGRGQLEDVRRELAENKAIDELVERAKKISVEDAKKAGIAYTPSRAEQEEEPGLWNV
ncbi:MAG: trigger factor [Solirubrobacteraceae bacterium]|nr:trigger factor [Solirubrobacteraceae bacterium]